MKKKIYEKEHPFPNEVLLLMSKIHKDRLLDKEDEEILSNIVIKYLNLRSDVFREI